MARLHHLYSHKDSVLPQDKWLFAKTIESWEGLSSYWIQGWCNSADKAIAKSVNLGLSQIIATHRSLDVFVICMARPPGHRRGLWQRTHPRLLTGPKSIGEIFVGVFLGLYILGAYMFSVLYALSGS